MNSTYYKALGVECNDAQGNCYFIDKCSNKVDKFTDLVIQLASSRGLIVPPSAYLLDKKSTDGKDACLIGVQRNPDPNG